MRPLLENLGRGAVLALAAWAPQAPGVVEAISQATTPSETVSVFRGVGHNTGDEALPPTYIDVSATGRYVLYWSMARNILPGLVDAGSGEDLFLFDRTSRQTTLVSHGPGSSEPFNEPGWARLSEDGSTVLFVSRPASSLGPYGYHLFDRASGTTRFLANSGGWEPDRAARVISADGSWSTFVGRRAASDPEYLYLYEKATDTLHPVPVGAGCVGVHPEISGDGGVVLFQRFCGADAFDVAAYDRSTGAVTRIVESGTKGALSRDGRFVLFGSRRADVLPGLIDLNGSGFPDLYRYDRLTQETSLVNRGASPLTTWTGPGADVASARISDDGSVVALTEGFSSGQKAPFVFRVATGIVQEVGRLPGTMYLRGITLSGDGRTLAYTSWYDIVVVDVPTMTGRRVTSTSFPGVPPNGFSFEPVLSRDGSLVVFASAASNLGVGIRDFDRTAWSDTSLYGVELWSDRVEPLSIAGNPSRVQFTDGAGALLSADGQRIAFSALSNASSSPDRSILEPVPILRDRTTGVAIRVGDPGPALALSDDGSTAVVAFGEGMHAYRDTGIQGPVVVGGRPVISSNGDRVVYIVYELYGGPAARGVIRLWDVPSGTTRRISRSASTGGIPDGESAGGLISGDGRFVAFTSFAGDLLPGAPFGSGQSNVFLFDVEGGSLKLVSVGQPSIPASGPSRASALSSDGRFLAMTTEADSMGGLNFPPGDSHVVLYDRVLGTYILASGAATEGMPTVESPRMDASGRYVVFVRTGSTPMGPVSTAFLFDRQTGLVDRVIPGEGGNANYEQNVSISADGSTIALQSRAWMPFPPSWPWPAPLFQVYVVDRRTRRVTLASHGAAGEAGNNVSFSSALDAKGDVLAFRSAATNLGVDLGYTTGGYAYIDPLGATARPTADFLFLSPPIVYSTTPACASTTGGRTVTIEGAHFKPGSTVTLDGIPATVTSVTSTSITVVTGARAPMAARTGHVEVRSPDGEYDVLGNAFTYAVRGDANNSGALTAADGFYLNMALFLGGPQPASLCNGDANGSGATTSADAFFLNLYLFLGGAPPPP